MLLVSPRFYNSELFFIFPLIVRVDKLVWVASYCSKHVVMRMTRTLTRAWCITRLAAPRPQQKERKRNAEGDINKNETVLCKWIRGWCVVC